MAHVDWGTLALYASPAVAFVSAFGAYLVARRGTAAEIIDGFRKLQETTVDRFSALQAEHERLHREYSMAMQEIADLRETCVEQSRRIGHLERDLEAERLAGIGLRRYLIEQAGASGMDIPEWLQNPPMFEGEVE